MSRTSSGAIYSAQNHPHTVRVPRYRWPQAHTALRATGAPFTVSPPLDTGGSGHLEVNTSPAGLQILQRYGATPDPTRTSRTPPTRPRVETRVWHPPTKPTPPDILAAILADLLNGEP